MIQHSTIPSKKHENDVPELSYNLRKHNIKNIVQHWAVKFLMIYGVGMYTESQKSTGNTNEGVNIPKVYWFIIYSYERHNSYFGREKIVSIRRLQYSQIF
jgi:hypothetical protein